MNTLGKKVTATFFETAEDYVKLKALWSKLVNDQETAKLLGPEYHLLYAILMGKDWRKGFSPIKNANKLANGGTMEWGARIAVNRIHNVSYWAPRSQAFIETFGGLITVETLKKVVAILPQPSNALLDNDAYLLQEEVACAA